MSEPLWKVGELAKRTGVSVRTLHHYDEIGLLVPSHHTLSGHRLYTGADVARLQQILSLKQLGFSLDDISGCLNRGDLSARQVVGMHLQALRELIAKQQSMCARLTWLAGVLEQSAEDVPAEQLLDLVEALTQMEQYYTPEQLQYLAERRKQFTDEQMQQAQQEWTDLIARVQDAVARGLDPASPEAQSMAKRWMEKAKEFTGGDPGIEASLKKMYSDPANVERYAGGQAVGEFIEKALESMKKE
jgi:DNA-binding transcriptional MerR regulator